MTWRTGSDHQEDDDTSRSRSRVSNNSERRQRQWPNHLAEQVARRVAMDTALDMAEAIEITSSSMEPPSAGIVNDSNYLPSSVPVANFFNIMPVPREPLALEDHRWDLLGQGTLLPWLRPCPRPGVRGQWPTPSLD